MCSWVKAIILVSVVPVLVLFANRISPRFTGELVGLYNSTKSAELEDALSAIWISEITT